MEVVARIGVGYDAVEVPALTARGVPLMVAGSANSTSVAEQAFHLMIALAKKNAALDRLVKGGRWADRHGGLPMELAGKTVLIVGFGRIGTRTARRCVGFDMTVLILRPLCRGCNSDCRGMQRRSPISTPPCRAPILCRSTARSIPKRSVCSTRPTRRMKKGAFIVNTARGGIIDEPALHAALTSGHLAGAGLDVFDQEPTPVNNALLSLDSVITSPHMAGVTVEAVAAMAVATAGNILSVLDGDPNRDNVINKEVLR